MLHGQRRDHPARFVSRARCIPTCPHRHNVKVCRLVPRRACLGLHIPTWARGRYPSCTGCDSHASDRMGEPTCSRRYCNQGLGAVRPAHLASRLASRDGGDCNRCTRQVLHATISDRSRRQSKCCTQQTARSSWWRQQVPNTAIWGGDVPASVTGRVSTLAPLPSMHHPTHPNALHAATPPTPIQSHGQWTTEWTQVGLLLT